MRLRAFFLFYIMVGAVGISKSQNINTATNGLYKPTGSSVGLGGTLNTNTTIDLGATYFFKLSKSSQDYITVLNGGNVGINTSNPGYTLDVNGAVRIGSLSSDPTGAAGVLYYNTVLNKLKAYVNGGWKNVLMEGDVSGENPNDFIQNQNSNDQVANFRISGSGIFGGNLGIQTANPQYPLDVNGKARFSGEVAIQGTAGSNIITGTRGSDGEVKFTVDNQGNVWNSGAYSGASLGAWTVSPKGHNAFMKFGGGSGWVEFHLYNDQGDIDRTFYYRIGNTLDLRTRVNSTGANDMSIMNFNNDGSVFFSGNVGIKTNNPQYPLDVNGRIRTNERIQIGGDPNAGNGDPLLYINASDYAADKIALGVANSGGQNIAFSVRKNGTFLGGGINFGTGWQNAAGGHHLGYNTNGAGVLSFQNIPLYLQPYGVNYSSQPVIIGNESNDGFSRLIIDGILKLGNIASDPLASAGGIFYNSSTNKFRGYQNGAWKNFLMEGDVSGGTLSLPTNQIAYGSGSGITSSSGFVYDASNNILKITPPATFTQQTAIRLNRGGTPGSYALDIGLDASDNIAFHSNNADYLFSASGSTRLKIGATGGVGILTTTPYGTLSLGATGGTPNRQATLSFKNITNSDLATLMGITEANYQVTGAVDNDFYIHSRGNNILLSATGAIGFKLNTSNNPLFPTLASGSTSPTQSGTVHMLTVDANGLLGHQALSSGGPALTANNGLTLNNNNIVLGGSLNQNTTFETNPGTTGNGYELKLNHSGFNNSNLKFYVAWNGNPAIHGYNPNANSGETGLGFAAQGRGSTMYGSMDNYIVTQDATDIEPGNKLYNIRSATAHYFSIYGNGNVAISKPNTSLIIGANGLSQDRGTIYLQNNNTKEGLPATDFIENSQFTSLVYNSSAAKLYMFTMGNSNSGSWLQSRRTQDWGGHEAYTNFYLNPNGGNVLIGALKTTNVSAPMAIGTTKMVVTDENGQLSYADIPSGSGSVTLPSTQVAYGSTGNTVTGNSNLTFDGANLYVAGNIGIGTTTPQAKLAVNGDIFSKKVKVIQTGWPDYVFESNYRLPTLKEIEAFIKQHKHLPEVPSAAEVKKEGLDIGDNQAMLLKKIEELTLYVIEQNKKIEELQEKVEKLSRK